MAFGEGAAASGAEFDCGWVVEHGHSGQRGRVWERCERNRWDEHRNRRELDRIQ